MELKAKRTGNYANTHCTVVGISNTRGAPRVHTVSVPKKQYSKQLKQEGRTNVRLIELTEPTLRSDAVAYAATVLTKITPAEKAAMDLVISTAARRKVKGKFKDRVKYTNGKWVGETDGEE